MRLILFFFFMFTMIWSVQGQNETLLSGNNTYGGFGGPILEFSSINGTTVADIGGGGALVINDFFFGGYGTGSDAASLIFEEQRYDIDFGHGGFWMGYAHNEYKLFHLYSSLRLGWGEAEFKQNDQTFYDDNFFTLNPELGIEVNVTDWFKLGFNGGYRYISGINTLPTLDADDFSGLIGSITFRFGAFGEYD